MKTITQYKADIKALMVKADDIDRQCKNENREPTSAELVLINEILDTVQEYQDIVKTMERQERVADSLEAPDNALTLPRNARVTVGQDMREKDRFPSLGSQLMAVLNACPEVNGRVDPRLRIRADAASGLSETIPSDGGFLVQTDFSTELMNEAFETGILPSKCSEVPISGSSNSMTINGFDETSRASLFPINSSGIPPTSVERIGSPRAAASSKAIGVPSVRDGITNMSQPLMRERAVSWSE